MSFLYLSMHVDYLRKAVEDTCLAWSRERGSEALGRDCSRVAPVKLHACLTLEQMWDVSPPFCPSPFLPFFNSQYSLKF